MRWSCRCSPRTPTPNPGSRSPAERTYLPGEKPEISVNAHNVRTAGVPRLSREQSGEVLQPDAGAAQLRRPGSGHAEASAYLAGKVSCLEASHLGLDSRFHPRPVLAGFAPPDSPVGDGRRRKETGPKVESFAQVPVLNQQQVVSVWKWTVPAHEQWESMTVAVPVSDKGVYLVEATDGRCAPTPSSSITEIAIITKAGPGRLMSFVVDRRSGDPIVGMLVRVWIDQKEVASKTTDAAGPARHAHRRRQAGERCGAGYQRRPVRHQHARARGTWATIPIAV